MTTALLSLLFFCFSLFLSSRSFFSFLSRKKIMYFPSCIKKSSTRWCFEENFFVFFLHAQKEHKRSTKGKGRTHDLVLIIINHHSSSIVITFFHLFSSSHQHQHQQHTTRPLLLRDFFCDYAHAERERESVCAFERERERERRSLSESERVCSFYVSCGL